MIRSMQFLVAGLVLIMAAALQPAFADPVECSDQGNAVTRVICANPELRELDRDMAEAYRAALWSHPEAARALRRDQRDWRAGRDD